MKEILFVAAIVITGSIVAFLLARAYGNRDIPEQDASDLIVDRPNIPAEENAFTYFSAAENVLGKPGVSEAITGYLKNEAIDSDLLEAVLANCAETLERVHQGIECQRCIAPEVTALEMTPAYQDLWRSVQYVMTAKVKHDRLAGRHADATATCIALLRCADMIQRDAESIMNYLAGIDMEKSGLIQARNLARDPNTPVDELRRLSEALAHLSPIAQGFIRAIKGEYRLVANTTDQLKAGQLGLNELVGLKEDADALYPKSTSIPETQFQPNRVKHTFAELYRKMIQDASRPYNKMNEYNIKRTFGVDPNTIPRPGGPNAMGTLVYGFFVPSVDALMELKCRIECSLEATRILAALALYRHDKGHFPATVWDIVPEYLPAVPQDPYDGQPFRYNLKAGFLYSVGVDLKASEKSLGKEYKDQGHDDRRRIWQGDDLVYELE